MYKIEKYLRNTLQKIRKDHPESYQDVEDFVEDMLAEGISIYRMSSYAIWLNKILKITHAEFYFRNVSALREKEQKVLREIYLAESTPTTGEVYDRLRGQMGYTTFFEILEKLERLRFIDLVYARKGRGNTRLIHRKYNVGEMLKAIARAERGK